MAYSWEMRFEWDEAKDRANRKKHNLGFDEARELFTSGVDYLELYDETHSEQEERLIAIGPIRRGVVLVVWTERAEQVIRIVSARFATRSESDLFQKYIGEKR